ncbi:zygote-specific protein [Pyricularia oryzae]|nr:zygote-specific protein [Pyricularia oryzae]KAI7911653.1 zygote-specific protein [Pyricularia oryzae]
MLFIAPEAGPDIVIHSYTDNIVNPIMQHSTIAHAIMASAVLSGVALAGPAAYGICQAGCSGVVMACYGAAGFTWGATLGASAPASILACNTAFGACQASCHAVLFIPGP